MAQVGVWGPFQGSGQLAPGESRWMQLGEHDSLGPGAGISVTASGYGDSNGTYVLKVDDVNITCERDGHGDTQTNTYYAGCNVTNTGATTVKYWHVFVGVVIA